MLRSSPSLVVEGRGAIACALAVLAPEICPLSNLPTVSGREGVQRREQGFGV